MGPLAERVRHDLLDLGRMLCRAVDEHHAVFLGDGDGDLALEIKVVLAADAQRALQPPRSAAQHLVRSAAHDSLRWQHRAVRRERRANVEDRRQRFVVDACAARRAPRRPM